MLGGSEWANTLKGLEHHNALKPEGEEGLFIAYPFIPFEICIMHMKLSFKEKASNQKPSHTKQMKMK